MRTCCKIKTIQDEMVGEIARNSSEPLCHEILNSVLVPESIHVVGECYGVVREIVERIRRDESQ